jgi:hypothetical protein
VELSPAQIRIATWIGKQRNAYAISHRLSHVFKATDEQGEANHILGACCECAVAKHIGHSWEPNIGKTRGDDVGPVQVRGRRKHSAGLIIRPRDEAHWPDPWVLVTGLPSTGLFVRGWVVGTTVVERGVYCDPGEQGAPCWEFPQFELRPIPEMLDRLVRGDRAGWRFEDR